jgi:hypothetical protein
LDSWTIFGKNLQTLFERGLNFDIYII